MNEILCDPLLIFHLPSVDHLSSSQPPTMEQPDNTFLKTNMNLYKDSKIKQTLLEAMEIAFLRHESLCPSHFSHLDILHYNGIESLHLFADKNNFNEGNKIVLDLGSGTGGPGRYLAWEYPVDVVGVEYNQELARVSSLLSRLLCVPSLSFPFPSPTSNPTPSRSSLSPSVSKVPGTFSVAVGDATKFDVQKHNLEGRVDSIISQLAILHINDKKGVFDTCQKLLKQNGTIWIEDYFINGDKLSAFDEKLLHEDVGINSPQEDLTTLDQYKKYMEDAGFVIDHIEDETEKWSQFVWLRYENFLKKCQAPDNLLTVSGGSVGGSSIEFREEMSAFYLSVCLVLCPKQGKEEMMKNYPIAMSEGAIQNQKTVKEFGDYLVSLPRTLGGVQITAHKK